MSDEQTPDVTAEDDGQRRHGVRTRGRADG